MINLLKLSDPDRMPDELARLPSGQAMKHLFTLICSADEEIKWRAVTGMGIVVSEMAKKDMEAARKVMRRLMWSLNDESGAVGWGAPEAMAEIMARSEELAKEFAHILVSYTRPDGNYLEFEPLLRGAIWGIGRLAQARPQLLQEAADYLTRFLESTDPTIRGLAAWALGLIGKEAACPKLEKLLGDNSEMKIFLDNGEVLYKVRDLAHDALISCRKTTGLSPLSS